MSKPAKRSEVDLKGEEAHDFVTLAPSGFRASNIVIRWKNYRFRCSSGGVFQTIGVAPSSNQAGGQRNLAVVWT
jgi:hypothetical protein